MKRFSDFDLRVSAAKWFSIFNFRVSWLLAVVASTLLLASPLPHALAQGPATQAVKPSATQIDSKTLLAQADDLFQEMSRITGLPIKAPLKKQILSRKEIEKYLVENLHAEYTHEELQIQEATLRAFGLASREFDLEKFLVTFYTEQAAGFYDPRRKAMFMADWVNPDMQKLVLAHELTHALQDQNFDMEKFIRAARADDDATGARQAVVEGHATAAMLQLLVGPVELASLPSLGPLMKEMTHQRVEEFPAFSQAPYFFRLQALFPYTEGMGFMQRGLARGGWKTLNSLFSRPPTSTKEIFEPALYFDRKPLAKISLPRPPSLASVAGLRVLAENVMGELGYHALLGQLISEEEAKSVAPAWLADRYILYEREPEATGHTLAQPYALVARTLWSSSESALALFRDYHTILAKKYTELAPDARSGADLFIGSTAAGQVILLRKGDEVSWAEGVPSAQADRMLTWLRSL